MKEAGGNARMPDDAAPVTQADLAAMEARLRNELLRRMDERLQDWQDSLDADAAWEEADRDGGTKTWEEFKAEREAEDRQDMADAEAAIEEAERVGYRPFDEVAARLGFADEVMPLFRASQAASPRRLSVWEVNREVDRRRGRQP